MKEKPIYEANEWDSIGVGHGSRILQSFSSHLKLNHRNLPNQGTGEDEDVESSSLNLMETEDGFQPVFFDPRPLKNLLLIDETSSLMPITDMKVGMSRTDVKDLLR